MLVFDLIAGLIFVAVILGILLVGVGHSHRLQEHLQAEAEARRLRRARTMSGLDRRSISRHEIDEAMRQVVRARRDAGERAA